MSSVSSVVKISSPYRTYIAFSTVANPRQTGEDTYSKYSARSASPRSKG